MAISPIQPLIRHSLKIIFLFLLWIIWRNVFLDYLDGSFPASALGPKPPLVTNGVTESPWLAIEETGPKMLFASLLSDTAP